MVSFNPSFLIFFLYQHFTPVRGKMYWCDKSEGIAVPFRYDTSYKCLWTDRQEVTQFYKLGAMKCDPQDFKRCIYTSYNCICKLYTLNYIFCAHQQGGECFQNVQQWCEGITSPGQKDSHTCSTA